MINYLKKYKGFDVVLFFSLNIGKKYSINQISKILTIAPNTSEIICKALYTEDFLTKEIVGKSHLYSLNIDNSNANLIKRIAFPYLLESDKTKKMLKDIKENIISCYLYGSCAFGTYDSKSDLDLFILTTNKIDKNKYFEIKKYFESITYDRNVQLNIKSLLEFKKIKNTPYIKEVKKGIKIYGDDL